MDSNEEVVAHWPPQYIIGSPVGEEVCLHVVEHELVTVRMMQTTCEYMFSNPTNKFNLSLTDKKLKLH